MVNTFLISADFQKSAQRLNQSHLGKQRVEAYQILNNILDLYHFGKRLDCPLPKDQSLWYDWIRFVVKAYKRWDHCYVCFHSLYVPVPRSFIKSGTKFETPFRKVGFGFVYHPAVLMWLGWPEALKAYLNAHIDEWVARGNENNLKKYWLPDEVEYPPWIDDSLFHRKQKAALIAKEIEAEETGKRRSEIDKCWYRLFDDFEEARREEQILLKRKYGKERPLYEYFWPSPNAWTI